MGKIVVFGAGGRAGRHAVAEAVARGHEVTAVVRDPAKYAGPAEVDVVSGDVTDPGSVAAAAAGHDAAINAAVRLDLPSSEFFSGATHALLDGLAKAGVGRLLLVGIGTVLETELGIPVYDTPGFPPEAREFSLGHVAELEILQAADTPIDWLVLAPPPVVLDDEAPRTGRYRIGGTQVPSTASFAYADLAVALIDEIEAPTHHCVLAAVVP
jgi:putative NADH-flavin reductase